MAKQVLLILLSARGKLVNCAVVISNQINRVQQYDFLTLTLLVCQQKMIQKTLKKNNEPLAHGNTSESTQRELSDEYQT